MKICPEFNPLFEKASFFNAFLKGLKYRKYFLICSCITVVIGLLTTACSDEAVDVKSDYRYYLKLDLLGEAATESSDVFSELTNWINNQLSEKKPFTDQYGVWEIVGDGDTKEERVSDADAKAIERFDKLSPEINAVLEALETDFIALRKEKSEQIKNKTEGYINLSVRCWLIKEENTDNDLFISGILKSSKVITLSVYAGETYE